MNMEHLLPRVPDFPAITIHKNGAIVIHYLTVKRYDLMGVPFEILGFDRITKILTIRPSMDESDGSCKLSKHTSGALVISAKRFLDENNIPYSKRTRVFPVDWNPTKDCIEVKLN